MQACCSIEPQLTSNGSVLKKVVANCDHLSKLKYSKTLLYVFTEHGSIMAASVLNTKTLFECAKKAGIKKNVQISVTKATESDSLPYYRGKALQEKMLRELGINFNIIRPTLVF